MSYHIAYDIGRRVFVVSRGHTNYFSLMIFLDPINPVFYSNSAAVYLDLKKYPKAREMCLKAIDLSMEYGVDDKIFGKILARLGNLDQQEGNYSSGLYNVGAILEAYRESSRIVSTKSFNGLKLPVLAVNWYRKSLKFNPNDKKPDKNLNFCQNKLKNEKRKALWVSFSLKIMVFD